MENGFSYYLAFVIICQLPLLESFICASWPRYPIFLFSKVYLNKNKLHGDWLFEKSFWGTFVIGFLLRKYISVIYYLFIHSDQFVSRSSAGLPLQCTLHQNFISISVAIRTLPLYLFYPLDMAALNQCGVIFNR